MKPCFVYLSFLNLCVIGLNAQDKIEAGKITYEFSENKSQFTEERHDFFDQVHKQGEGIKFLLAFSGKKSVFEIASKLENDFTPLGRSWAEKIVAKGNYYTDLEEKVVYRQTDAYGEKVVVKSKIDGETWNLTNESKSIGKYKVYKATKNKTIKNSKGAFNFEIVAWYCPEIPKSFGPKEYNSLPGLILELRDTHFTFNAVNMEFMEKGEIEIKPFKGKIYTDEEYNEIIKGIKPGYLFKNE